MAIDFSSLDATPAKTGKIDFTALGAIPAVGQDEPTDETSALGAAGRGAAGMIPLGTQALAGTSAALEGKPYLQERQEIEKEIQADIASHPIARVAGQAAGIAAPALLTAGSSVPETALGAIGQGAAIGAGFGAGNALDTLASGGSGAKAVGDVALGAGLGAAGGAVGQKLTGLAGKAVPGVEEFAARKASQAVGLGADELGNMSQQEVIDTGKMLVDKGIVSQGASTQEMFDRAKALHESYGDTIGQIGAQAKELGLTTDTKPLLDALDSKYQAASALANPDERKAALFYKRGMADIMTMARQNAPEFVGQTTLPEAAESIPDQITFDQLQRLKKSYGTSAFENGAVKNPAAADVYGQLSAGQKTIVNNVASDPNLPAQLKDAMNGYSKLYPIVDGLQDVLGRERAGTVQPRAFGMMGKLAASMPGQSNPAINALTSLGLMGAGHPLWGIGAFTATLNNPRVMSTAAQGIANAIPGTAATLPVAGAQLAAGSVHQNMGETKPINSQGAGTPSQANTSTTINVDHPALAPWKSIFQKNAANAKDTSEVQKANAVTDFILSQRDPAYAAAKQKMSENPTQTSPTNVPNMAQGGVIPETNGIDEPIPAMGSTLQGFANQLKSPTHEAPSVPMEDLPVNPRQKFHQPFNTDMADKLKAYLEGKEKDDAESR